MHMILLPRGRAKRTFETLKHPDQAAIAARLPLLGRRVPDRGYWMHAPIQPRRALRHGMEAAGSGLIAGGRSGRRMSDRALRRMSARGGADGRRAGSMIRRQGRLWPMAAGIAIGAIAMYYFDRHQGRRRRALMRDRLAHYRRIVTRELPETAERRGRFLRGVARGVRHNAAEVMGFNGGHATPDDETLVDRVRSEVLRDSHIKAGEIHIDAYAGCVTLRGQLERPDEIRRLVDATRRVDGVLEVRSYLHLPGTPPPNKAEAYRREEVPSHYAR